VLILKASQNLLLREDQQRGMAEHTFRRVGQRPARTEQNRRTAQTGEREEYWRSVCDTWTNRLNFWRTRREGLWDRSEHAERTNIWNRWGIALPYCGPPPQYSQTQPTEGVIIGSGSTASVLDSGQSMEVYLVAENPGTTPTAPLPVAQPQRMNHKRHMSSISTKSSKKTRGSIAESSRQGSDPQHGIRRESWVTVSSVHGGI